MSPIADGNLHGFYARVSQNPDDVKTLRTFFGCLTSAVEYLHNSKIRHRDIKPENILVKGSNVYLTDFGISLDWENLSRGTTTADSGKTRLYCAPEVADHQSRNASSDIWSLGCVFLEMCTVLKGRTTDEMRQSFKKRSDTHAFYANLPAIQYWLNTLRDCGSELDDAPLEWSASMLQLDRNSRPLAQNLYKTISKCKSTSDRDTRTFCADCCVVDDEESTVGSASDGELWAENLDDEVTSPPLTDETIKADGSKSSDQEALSGNSGSSIHPDSMDPLSQSFTVHQAPPFPVDLPNASHGSPTSPQNVAHSRFPSEPSAHSLTKTKLPVSSHQLGANLDTSKASLAVTPPLEQSALSRGSDTVFPKQTNMHPKGSEKQLFATAPDSDTGKQLARRANGEFPPAQAREPDINKQLKQGAIHEIPTAQEDLVDINGSRRKYVFVKLPKLSLLDWQTPLALLEALERDEQVTKCFHHHVPEMQARPKSNPLYINRIVSLLIEDGLNLNSEGYQDDNGFSPLVCVLKWSKTDDFESLFSFMIEAGANLSIRVQEKPDKPAVSLFWLAAAQGSVWAVDALVHHDVSKPSGWLSDLHQSSLKHNQPEVLKFLIDHKGLKLDFTPQDDFRVACENGSEGILQLLLNGFAPSIDIEKFNRRISPFFMACERGHLGVVRVLLAHGAIPNNIYNYDSGDSSILRAATPLSIAAKNGHADVVKLILEVAGNWIKVNELVHNGSSALYQACMHGHVEAAQHLLAYGADPNVTTGIMYGNWSCLHRAASDGRTNLVKSLLDYGATTSIRTVPMFTGARIAGNTPLSLAMSAGHTEIMEMLIVAKAREKNNKTQKGSSKGKQLAQDTKGNDTSPEDAMEKNKSVQDVKEKKKNIKAKKKTA